jgi:hypothetical protein
MYLGRDGIYIFNGQQSSLVSDQVTPEIRDISDTNFINCWGEFISNLYYLAYASKASGASANNRVLVFDIISRSYTKDLLSINSLCSFNSGTDTGGLYYGSSADGKVYSYFTTIHEIVHTKQSDFTGTFTAARYIPERWGGDAENPIVEIARTGIINSLAGTINAMTGTIDRETATGDYISQVMPLTADSFDKIYWNESIPATGGDVTFQIRQGNTEASCTTAAWGTAVSDPSGSDISGITPTGYFQYRINLSTDDLGYSPTVYDNGQYAVRIVYNLQGATGETSLPLHWQSGWDNLGYPGYKKTLRKFYCIHEGTAGTLKATFTNLEGDTDIFNIDLTVYPESYTEYFTGGGITGEYFMLDIEEPSTNALKIKQIIVYMDIEPLV